MKRNKRNEEEKESEIQDETNQKGEVRMKQKMWKRKKVKFRMK